MMYSTAFGIEQWARKTKALRLQLESLTLRSKEGEHQFSCIWNEMFELAIYRVESEDGVLPDIRGSMLETCAAGGWVSGVLKVQSPLQSFAKSGGLPLECIHLGVALYLLVLKL
jgi:hypothetical protein